MVKTAKGQRQKEVDAILEQWRIASPQLTASEPTERKRKSKGSRKGRMAGKGGPQNGLYDYRGVRQRKWGKWVAEIREPNGGRRLWLGSFDNPHEAALKYDEAAATMYGSSARLNHPPRQPRDIHLNGLMPSTEERSQLDDLETELLDIDIDIDEIRKMLEDDYGDEISKVLEDDVNFSFETLDSPQCRSSSEKCTA